MTNPFFSIIIPAFNAGGHIQLCLQSILSQHFKSFEVLIMDGGSADDTVGIVKANKDERLIVYSEKDAGIYDAMNKGIDKATGKWLYFMGSDDKLHDAAVLDDVHKKLANASKKVAYGNVLVNGSNRWAKHGELYAGKFTLYHLMKRNICHQSIFYNRDFLLSNNLRYDLQYPVSADWDLNIRCWQLTAFYFINRSIAIFDSGGFSSVVQRSDNYEHDILLKFPHLKGRYRANPVTNQMVKLLLPIKELLKKKRVYK
jgi:glycosyltransferase involved in cell wall biosynthesis